jgi:hydrogenase-4 component B
VQLFLCALAVLIAGAAICLAVGRRRGASVVGAGSCLIGSALAVVSAGRVLADGKATDTFFLPWSIPFGSFSVGLDGLSAFFAAVIALVAGLAAIYGVGYLKSYAGRKNLGATWFYYNILAASMLMVVSARNGMLFLIAWEIMSLSSFFLVMFEDDKPETIAAGWTYLVATHLGTAFLLAMFVLLSWQNGTISGKAMDFAGLSASSPAMATTCFLLALIGFGTKAGLVPMHVWLPQAHPAAPSHVSAVMSGVMIKTGIYGLLRTLTFLDTPPVWWGWLLVALGACSGVYGVLMALAQRDIKRLLAYSSVDNIGIIAIGLGLGLVGISTGNAAMACLGMLGGLMHVLNHAIFKSLLFLAAGSVVHATGSRDIEQMGGLMKRMATTGAVFLIGSAAIAGLVPLNGFVSEFLIYVGAFGAIAGQGTAKSVVLPALTAILALAMIGGLAVACFTRAAGVVFLGSPRSDIVANAHEAPLSMRLPMIVLALLCLAIGLGGPIVVLAVIPAVAVVLPEYNDLAQLCAQPGQLLWYVSLSAGALLVMIVSIALLRKGLLAGRNATRGETWGCGYAASSPRVQYTASSFAQPILGLFKATIRPAVQAQLPKGLFPATASLQTRVDDMFAGWLFRPIFVLIARVSVRLHWLQAGANQLYVLYVALAILVLLVWKLGLCP